MLVSSSQTDKVEHMIRATIDIMCSLFQASVLARYWVESLHTATYLLNRLSTKALSAPTRLILPSSEPLLSMTTFVSLGVCATPVSMPQLLISFPVDPLVVCFSGTLLIIWDIDVLTSPTAC